MKIGIDVGGTQVKIGFVEGKNIVHKFAIDTNKETLFDEVCLFVKQKVEELNITNLEGIGIGVPGNIISGYITLLPNVGIRNFDLHKKMKEYFPNTVIGSGNDANVAALGEALIKDIKNAIFVTLGTGVGGGVIVNGKVIEGITGSGGEIGHMQVDNKYNFQCGCGLKGCLETLASATGIVRLCNTYMPQYPNSILYGKEVTCKDVIDAAKVNDELGLLALNEACDSLARALSLLAVTTNPDSFIIGGGVSKAGDILIDTIKKYYDNYAYFGVKNTKIELATLGNDAGILGAAFLV